MRLGDLDALMTRLEKKKPEVCKQRYIEGFNDAIMRVRSMVHSAPTVDAEPVVHGRWVWNKDTGEIQCSLCNSVVAITMCEGDTVDIKETEKYCFACGAKMDLETK